MHSHNHSHHHVDEQDKHDPRFAEIRKVTLIGSLVDLLLGIGKIIIGYIAYSQALVADGIHSLSDLVTDVMVLIAAKHASRDADEDHPYGHGRIETVMTVVLGATLIIVATGIAYDSITRLFSPEEILVPTSLALVIAIISIIAKEVIYHYTMRAARRLRSKLLRANAWHSRSDAISSVIVVIGVAGSMSGLFYLDAIAAVAVGFMIARIGWELAYSSFRELIDTALDQERVQEIENLIEGVDGVNTLHMLRTRSMGADALVDVHILVDPKLSVSEGHLISEQVRQQLMEKIEDVRDVMVHIDPEDDEAVAPSSHLPGRKQILSELHRCWQTIEPAAWVDDVTLHYLNGAIHVEAILPLHRFASLTDADEAVEALCKAAKEIKEIENIKILFSTHNNSA